jgi:hypothetical protein
MFNNGIDPDFAVPWLYREFSLDDPSNARWGDAMRAFESFVLPLGSDISIREPEGTA